MTDNLKQLIKKKKLILTPTKDYFGNILEPGDMVIVAQHSNFTPGIIVSLPPKSITITCYRDLSAKKWDRKTSSYIKGIGGVSRDHSLFLNNSWWNHNLFENMQLIVDGHNSLHTIPIWDTIYSDGFRKAVSFINVTKLNLMPHENLKD